eukprot:3932079-Rhodomonas_salina.2
MLITPECCWGAEVIQQLAHGVCMQFVLKDSPALVRTVASHTHTSPPGPGLIEIAGIAIGSS